MENLKIEEYFGNVETTKEHNGYIYSVERALIIVIIGSLCGLREIRQIYEWASTQRVKDFFKEYFVIWKIPTYSWLLYLLMLIKPEWLRHRFTKWTTQLLPEVIKDLTITFDGKTICSTGHMSEYDKPLHILSAHFAELGLTIGQKTVDEKSNEIPAMRELIQLIDINGCMVTADALHCQTETAEGIVKGGGDYLLNAKDNQKTLKQDIEDFVQDTELRRSMQSKSTRELNGGRIECRRAFVCHDINWMEEYLQKWTGLKCIGAINRRFTSKDGKTTDEWHYYISSRKLTAEELLQYARNEWTIESMHWLLDVHLGEDTCRIRDRNINENLNIIRKIALNCIRNYKNGSHSKSKSPISRLMFGCLMDCENILEIINS